jgi:hypothetical protein
MCSYIGGQCPASRRNATNKKPKGNAFGLEKSYEDSSSPVDIRKPNKKAAEQLQALFFQASL